MGAEVCSWCAQCLCCFPFDGHTLSLAPNCVTLVGPGNSLLSFVFLFCFAMSESICHKKENHRSHADTDPVSELFYQTSYKYEFTDLIGPASAWTTLFGHPNWMSFSFRLGISLESLATLRKSTVCFSAFRVGGKGADDQA